jgi:tRNA A37 methylthiotransferase MiaB
MMRREHDSAGTRRLLADIRRMLPDAAVRTTVIAGHPGETEKEFRNCLISSVSTGLTGSVRSVTHMRRILMPP